MGHYSEDFVCPAAIQSNDPINESGLRLIGKHEVQVSEGGENDLSLHFKNCVKNPGHPEYIPIESFRVEHLPDGYQDNDLYEYIKATAELTVRISAKWTSSGRPEFFPNTKQYPYPLYELRGESTFRTGTGQVRIVRTYSDKVKQKEWYTTCPCDRCKDSGKPSQVWWKIYVSTAAHVVFDNIEASQTTLRLFYDSELSPEVILKDKVCVDYVNINRDGCMLSCVTCDEVLGNKLLQSWNHFNDVWRKVYDKHKPTRDIVKLSFIVSHPHGCAKQVSVGHWKGKLQDSENGDYNQFTYKTCTCPGSSGAFVHFVGYYSGWYTEHVHSGSLGDGLNTSGAGFLMEVTLIYESKKNDKKRTQKGPKNKKGIASMIHLALIKVNKSSLLFSIQFLFKSVKRLLFALLGY